uniref:Ribosome assembly factor mrt4 n=1 Tax=Globodera pallida TaxID=36090 RepID=A0A183BQR7_GLOPA
MPKSKRDKIVSLTKVKKKSREGKGGLLKEVRECIDQYKHLFVFSTENLRSARLGEIRQHFKQNSRIFFAKNNLMAVALGKTAEDEQANELHKNKRIMNERPGTTHSVGIRQPGSPRRNIPSNKQINDRITSFQYIRLGSIFASVIAIITYLAWFKNTEEIDELWSYDMRLVYIVAKKKMLREQLAQAKKDNRSTAELETELINLEANEEIIRTDEEKNRKKEERKKAMAARAKAKA